MNPRWRMPAGIFVILAWIAAWSGLVATAAGWVEGVHWSLRGLYFLVAGIAWIVPVKPLLRWMETGRWREAPGASDGT